MHPATGEKYNNAVVAGKFLPPHTGHMSLIQKATEVADHVDVILVANNKIDTYPPATRALSIYENFTRADIRVHIVDDIETDDDDPGSHVLWARYTLATLGYLPDVVVASENYGRGWAKAMDAEFIMHDQARVTHKVSGTLCRENAYSMRYFMPPSTRRFVQPRIVVLGAESTGTTTLANALGAYYNTPVVPEMGRLLEEEARRAGGGGDGAWNDQLFLLTSRGQDAMEERLAAEANGVLICDTDSWATSIWYEYYEQKGMPTTKEMKRVLHESGIRQADKHALYILTWNDIPFEQDELETRTGEHMRDWMTDRFYNELRVLTWGAGPAMLIVKGKPEDRLRLATDTIDAMLDARH